MNAADQEQIRAANEACLDSWRNFLDLTLPLTAELGRTQLTARAILGLEANSIIQLPRSSGEGVDILTGGRTIARGEIIMIEDRTGIRVNEIVMGGE
jgi:flagellar motor switch protein FliN/FliY